MKLEFWHHRRRLAVMLALLFVLSPMALGQLEVDEAAIDLFPFSDGDFNERTVDYSDELYDVTEEGVITPDGVPTNELVDSLGSLYQSIQQTVIDSEELRAANYRQELINDWGNKKAVNEKRLQLLNETVSLERSQFNNLDSTIADLEARLEPIHQEISSLKEQIEHLNQQITETQDKIETVEFQIADKQVMIRALMDDIKKKSIELEVQGDVVLDYIRLVYEEEEKFLGFNTSGDDLKLLLADNSVSENLLGRDYLTILESTGRKVFYDLYVKKQELEAKQDRLVKAREQLAELHTSLTDQKDILDQNRTAQKQLLIETRGQQEEYQQLLEQSIQQRLESAIAIQNLQDNLQFIETKLTILDDSLQKADGLTIDSGVVDELGELDATVQLIAPDERNNGRISKHQKFTWPVPPVAITTYFRDPTYPKKWGAHNAVDIRAPQFTSITAPANAVVYQVRDNGFGYSYIVLAHKNNLVTVYGHVSKILVEQGQVVQQGDVIGLTGGTPGTKGAGLQTTGPHLHFEVYLEGKPADPLDFLPVMALPVEYIPEKYFVN